MSRLAELGKELYPVGVKYKPLKDISIMARGSSLTKKSAKLGDIPVVSGGKQPAFYCDNSNRSGDIITVSGSGAGAGYVQYWDKPIFVADAFSVKGKEVNTKYLYYCLKNRQEYIYSTQKGGGVPHVHISSIENMIVPVPPMEVQREIVCTLDNFTELTEKLTTELTAELTARKQQYAYYRDSMFRPKIEWQRIKIIDMLSQPITDGPHITPNFTQEGIPFISVDAIWDGKIHFENMRGYISKEFDKECCKKYKPQKNDVLMVKSGSTTGKVALVETSERFNIWSPLAAMRVNNNNSPRYLFYLLQTEYVQNMVKSKASHGSQPNLSMRVLEQFEVCIPPLDVQNKIVNVLDNFDSICSDLNIGLPAEINARQKQYEYYRDKLLTFDESASTIFTDAGRRTPDDGLIKLYQYVYGYAVVELKDLVTVFRGEYITKKDEPQGNIPVILGGQEPAYYIDRANHNGEVVVVARSGVSAGFVSYWDEPIFITDGFGYEADPSLILPKYLYYVLKSMEKDLNSMKRGAGVPHIRGESILSLRIPVPTLDKQKQIISILSQFETLCSDLSTGIPAEINARQKQYEYYRDKLLTFKEKTA